MAKFGTEGCFGAGLVYGIDPQYLLGVGNIPSIVCLGMPTIIPGPVAITGVGNIPSIGAFGTPGIFLNPKKLALGVNIRRLSAAPQIRRLQVTFDG